MSVVIETGIALHKVSDGGKLKIAAPAVTSTSAILLTLEVSGEEIVTFNEREPGTGFTARLAHGGQEFNINWAVIN